MTHDTVFDREMRIVFHGTPDTVLRRLKAKYPETWLSVCDGKTQKVVSIEEYVFKEKFTAVEEIVRDVLAKKDQAIFRKMPERLDPHIRHAVKRIINVIQEGQ